jgi:hypothetical protein
MVIISRGEGYLKVHFTGVNALISSLSEFQSNMTRMIAMSIIMKKTRAMLNAVALSRATAIFRVDKGRLSQKLEAPEL